MSPETPKHQNGGERACAWPGQIHSSRPNNHLLQRNALAWQLRHPHNTQNEDVPVSENFALFDITYVGKPPYRFYKNISRLILKESDTKVKLIYRIFKAGHNFKLKSHTPLPLVSNIVYRCAHQKKEKTTMDWKKKMPLTERSGVMMLFTGFRETWKESGHLALKRT